MSKVGIIGAGTWGIALARVLANAKNEVTVWSAITSEIDELASTNCHPKLPGVILPGNICYTKEIEYVCREKDFLIMAVPSVFVRSTVALAAPYIDENQIVVDVAKGMEPETLYTMSEVILDELKTVCPEKNIHIVAFSGPTHAEEVSRDMPTTIVAACRDMSIAERVQELFEDTCMRVYTNYDIKGVEICGALKNVIALATGVATGLGLGDNTKAALITRGLNEISRLGISMGCNLTTFVGLAGMGDLIVTATSEHSRNNRAGQLIGQGYSAGEAIEKVGMVVEGINALPAALQLAQKHQIDMPIVKAIDAIVNNGKKPDEAVRELMARKQRSE